MYSVKSSPHALSNEQILDQVTNYEDSDAGLFDPRIDTAQDENGASIAVIIAQSASGLEFIIKFDDWLRRDPYYDDEGYFMRIGTPTGVEFALMAGLWRAGFRPVVEKKETETVAA